MKKRVDSLSDKAFDVFNIAFMICLSIVCIYPFIYILNISISKGISAAQYGLHIIPKGVTLEYYAKILRNGAIVTGGINSVIRTVVGTFLMVVFAVMGAYPLSKKHMPNRMFWTGIVIFTMFFEGGLIPTYLLVKSIGLIDSRWALILPGLVNTFYMLVTRNFLMTIPDSLEESAKIDGANDIVILIKIILPVCKPILATIALWSAVWHWNAWFDCLIYITKQNLIVLQVVLFRVVSMGMSQTVSQSSFDDMPYPEITKACTIIITMLPIILVYPFVQKYFIKGILIGSVKG